MRARAAMALLLLLCACERQKETPSKASALKDTLAQMRRSIDTFYQDHHRYPATLEELVPRYLARIPVDPATGSAKTWRLVREETVQPNTDFTTAGAPHAAPGGGIIDVRSGAAGYAEY